MSSQDIQPTNHTRLDPATAYWAEEREHGTPLHTALGEGLNEIDDDTASAVNEARGRADEREELERARPDLESLRAGFGSIPTALHVNRNLKEAYRRDPIAGREMHRRAYLQTLPLNSPPQKWQMAEAPADYTESAKDDHHLHESVRHAMHTAAYEKQYEAELAAAAPLLTLEKMEHGNLTTPLMVYGAAHEAMQIDPHAASRRLSYLTGAPTSETHANEQIAAVQYQQQYGELNQWLGQVAPLLPHFHRDDVQDLTAHAIRVMNQTGQRTGDHWQDLQTAYGHAVSVVGERMQAEQQQAAADQARRASRSLSGSGSTSDDFTPAARTFADGSVEADVARAYRSQFV